MRTSRILIRSSSLSLLSHSPTPLSASALRFFSSHFQFRRLLLLPTASHKIDSPPPPLLDSNYHLSSYRGIITTPKRLKEIEAIDHSKRLSVEGSSYGVLKNVSYLKSQVPKLYFTPGGGFGHSQRAVTIALWCNFLVFSLKFGVWSVTSSHVMLAEVVHSAADFANQALLAYGLSSSKRAPDALHPYGYSKERFVWSLISAVGIFCLGSGATIVHGVQNLWTSQPPQNITYAALVISGSFIIEGASLVGNIHAVREGAAAEGMNFRDYVWRGHDPTAVAVMTEDGAAVTGLLIAGASLISVNTTGNAIFDPIGSIVVGNLLGVVAIFLIQRNRHALIGRAIDDNDMERVLQFLKNDPVVDSVYDCKSEVIGPGFFRFKAEIDFNGEVLVQNYLKRTGCEEWARQFREAANGENDGEMLKIMSNYGEEVVTALGSEVDRLEKEIQDIVPGIRHVDIEAHNPIIPSP